MESINIAKVLISPYRLDFLSTHVSSCTHSSQHMMKEEISALLTSLMSLTENK